MNGREERVTLNPFPGVSWHEHGTRFGYIGSIETSKTYLDLPALRIAPILKFVELAGHDWSSPVYLEYAVQFLLSLPDHRRGLISEIENHTHIFSRFYGQSRGVISHLLRDFTYLSELIGLCPELVVTEDGIVNSLRQKFESRRSARDIDELYQSLQYMFAHGHLTSDAFWSSLSNAPGSDGHVLVKELMERGYLPPLYVIQTFDSQLVYSSAWGAHLALVDKYLAFKHPEEVRKKVETQRNRLKDALMRSQASLAHRLGLLRELPPKH
jgi:hypothetical protein